jgi:hypothetical protein
LAATALLWLFCYVLVTWTFAKGFFIVTGAIGLAAVIADVARGPRCRCFLHTAVSRELLSPVGRMRTARDFLAKLLPTIEAVQGAIAAEHILTLDDQTSAHAQTGEGDQPPELVTQPGYLPEVVFGVFLVNAVLILVSVLIHRNAQQVASVLLTTLPSELLLVIITLFRRGSRDLRRYIYLLMAFAILPISWDLILFMRNFVQMFTDAVDAGQHGRAAVIPEIAFDRQHGLIAAGWRAAAGIIGIVTAYFERPRSSPTPAQTIIKEVQPQ